MSIRKMARTIERHYKSHGVAIELIYCEVVRGGERYIFSVKLKAGTKEGQIFDRARDIQIALELPLFQPFRERLSICIAVSGRPITDNSLQKMLRAPAFYSKGMWVPIGLGYDMRGDMYFADLAGFPHSLYAGATNSGKTVGLRCAIAYIAATQPVNMVNLVIIDTGASGLDIFDGLPHLSYPIVKDVETAFGVLSALNKEMERRIRLPLDELRLLPALVCVSDEYRALISNVDDAYKNALVNTISNLLNRGRHGKVHIFLATQEPAKQDMLINRTNLNARMAFACPDFYASRAILGEGGAEKLPGKGAMLFKSPEYPDPVYIQGAYMSTDDIKQLVARIASVPHDLSRKFTPDIDLMPPPARTYEVLNGGPSKLDIKNKELADIIMWTLRRNNISARQIGQQFRIGNRAAALVDKLFQMGLISDKFANQPRKVLPSCIEDLSLEVIGFLEHNSYTKVDIQEAFNARGGVKEAVEGHVEEYAEECAAQSADEDVNEDAED